MIAKGGRSGDTKISESSPQSHLLLSCFPITWSRIHGQCTQAQVDVPHMVLQHLAGPSEPKNPMGAAAPRVPKDLWLPCSTWSSPSLGQLFWSSKSAPLPNASFALEQLLARDTMRDNNG